MSKENKSTLLKVQINLEKINKEKIFKGKKGQYIDLDIWVNSELSEFGHDVAVKQVYKDGDDFGGIYLGNGHTPKTRALMKEEREQTYDNGNDDLPF